MWLAMLRQWFWNREVYCPITAVHEEDEWLVMDIDQGLVHQPSEQSHAVVDAGFLMLEGKQCWPAKELAPDHQFCHGTSPSVMLQILKDGFIKSRGELVEEGGAGRPHTPDGVYSFSKEEVSMQSQYVEQGAVLLFTSTGIILSIIDSISLTAQ
jgi:hypothetical protein